ncbi:hypothetical protein SVIOM342S_01004 [Streptomyces violaceorubidus]
MGVGRPARGGLPGAPVRARGTGRSAGARTTRPACPPEAPPGDTPSAGGPPAAVPPGLPAARLDRDALGRRPRTVCVGLGGLLGARPGVLEGPRGVLARGGRRLNSTPLGR